MKNFIALCILCAYLPFHAKTIYFTPGQWGQLFNIEDPVLNADDHQMSMYYAKLVLEQQGYTVKQANSLHNLEDVHCIISFDISPYQINELSKYPREKCFTFLWEPPSVIPVNYDPNYHRFFSHVYTWHDGLVSASPLYKKFYYPVMSPMIHPLVPFGKRKLCTLIAGNKSSQHHNELYSARKDAIEYFDQNHPDDFDLYGRWWPAYKTYRGAINKKIYTLNQYKFCICYENIKDVPGYITEKIFDCFRCGCVPVYWGADNITDYIPADCFIDRNQFKNYDELYSYLKNMDEATFEKYLENIRNYLNSTAAQLYSIDMFACIILDLVHSIA